MRREVKRRSAPKLSIESANVLLAAIRADDHEPPPNSISLSDYMREHPNVIMTTAYTRLQKLAKSNGWQSKKVGGVRYYFA